jgi:hypothetical protein
LPTDPSSTWRFASSRLSEKWLCARSLSPERVSKMHFCLQGTRLPTYQVGKPHSRSRGSHQDEMRMIGIKTRSFLRRCPWIFHRDSRSVSIIN